MRGGVTMSQQLLENQILRGNRKKYALALVAQL